MTDPEAEHKIRATIDRVIAAIRSGDRETLRELLADGSAHIGTDPDEWWTKEQILATLEDATSVDGEQIGIEMGEITVHVHGDVAWVEGTGNFSNSQGERRPIRTTSVLVRENDQWREAQTHASIGVPNSTMFDS